MKHYAVGLVAYLVMTSGLPAQSPSAVAPTLLTRPERTGFNETSTYADVVAFMEAAADGSAEADPPDDVRHIARRAIVAAGGCRCGRCVS